MKSKLLIALCLTFLLLVQPVCALTYDELRCEIETTLYGAGYLHGESLYSNEMVELLLGTAAVESDMGKYRRSLSGGDDRGIFQMNPKTAKDIHKNFLKYNPKCKAQVMMYRNKNQTEEYQLEHNVSYQVIMAAMHYHRYTKNKSGLPDPKHIFAMSWIWKRFYNTRLGKGSMLSFYYKYKKYCCE